MIYIEDGLGQEWLFRKCECGVKNWLYLGRLDKITGGTDAAVGICHGCGSKFWLVRDSTDESTRKEVIDFLEPELYKKHEGDLDKMMQDPDILVVKCRSERPQWLDEMFEGAS